MATISNSSTTQNPDSNQWVVSQIQVELDEALAKLERYIEHRDERALIQECGEALQNSANVCSITGMDAQATLAQELTGLIDKHLLAPEKNSDQFLNTLSEGVLTLRASLQTAGGDAIFIKLTPRVNNIRALTEQPLASESDLFKIDLPQGFQAFSKSLGEPLIPLCCAKSGRFINAQ